MSIKLSKTSTHKSTSLEIPPVVPQSKSRKQTITVSKNHSPFSRTHVKKIKETVNNFSQPTYRYATSSNLLVNGEPTTCLIDTGALTSFISASYFKSRSLSLRSLTVNKQWVTANGSPIHVIGETQLTLSVGVLEITANFVIAKQLIIGVDILKPNNFIVNYDTNTLTCQSHSVSIQTITHIKTHLIHSNCSIDLLPNTTDIIWIQYDLPNVNLLVSPLGRLKCSSTIVTMCTEGAYKDHIPIFLTNTSPIPIRINHGDAIASISEAQICSSINSENDFDSFILREMNHSESFNSFSPSLP